MLASLLHYPADHKSGVFEGRLREAIAIRTHTLPSTSYSRQIERRIEQTLYAAKLNIFNPLHGLKLKFKIICSNVFGIDHTSGSEKAEDSIDHLKHFYKHLRQPFRCALDVGIIC
ncbi:hypothetical protein M440DRAFT_1448714 [Trichoderma longibrachiatum ATCC 18648]|uniref:Uncharacterized protein n=1 Tax=Trichoderma longibrachiatum ATCC 18648 TaxID=983965 RepID=A0A2T4BSE3_TRILO|nr:hypothetical protein M440DRAFT_1448714 [Trichoderma longibrachiatum ATCC 18648]